MNNKIIEVASDQGHIWGRIREDKPAPRSVARWRGEKGAIVDLILNINYQSLSKTFFFLSWTIEKFCYPETSG